MFTCILVTSAIDIIRNKLEQDAEFSNKTIISSNNIIELHGFCLFNNYFMLQGQFFEQTKWAAMGLSVSPIIANHYVEKFEHTPTTTVVNPPRIRKRYLNDTFVIQQQIHIELFLLHINSVDPSILFTVEDTRPYGSRPFLDTLVKPHEHGTLAKGVYRKPTHTDLYLKWDSQHNLACKYSVISTFAHRSKTVCSAASTAERRNKTSSRGPDEVQIS